MPILSQSAAMISASSCSRKTGAIRDLDVILEEDYGLTVYAKARSFHGNPKTRAAEENVQIQCGGALVRPGDVLVGDGDGVLVVASWMAAAVLEWAVEHEEVENYIKEKIRGEKVTPGKYYPPTAEMKDEWLQVKEEAANSGVDGDPIGMRIPNQHSCPAAAKGVASESSELLPPEHRSR